MIVNMVINLFGHQLITAVIIQAPFTHHLSVLNRTSYFQRSHFLYCMFILCKQGFSVGIETCRTAVYIFSLKLFL